MVKHCSYGLCKTDSRHLKEGVYFVRFPKPWIDMPKCKRWISSCNRKIFRVKDVTKDTYICSLHFVGEHGPTDEHPDPISKSTETFSLKRKRQSSFYSEPSCSKQTSQKPVNESSGLDQNMAREIGAEVVETEVVEAEEHKADDVDINVVQLDRTDNQFEIRQSSPPIVQGSLSHDTINTTDNKKEESTQTGIEVENPFIRKMQTEIGNLRENLEVAAVRFTSIARDEKKFKFYTGLTLKQFDVLWDFLDENKNCLRVWTGKDGRKAVSLPKKQLSPKDQLLICLMRLRSGFLEQDLAYRFNVSQGWISRIIITWIQYLYQYFKQLDSFPSREGIEKNPLPKVFRKFKNIRVILDCFEVNTQKPQDYREQGNMYSSYKAHSTFKFLLGIIPTGGICFLSEAFEGSMSDREIFVKSGLFDKLEHGDAIMVDKGFNVQDICNTKSITVYIPPFLKDRPQLTREEVQLTKNIASARIHVERCVGAMKQFRLLQKTLPKNLVPIISQTAFVISCLVNLREPLVV